MQPARIHDVSAQLAELKAKLGKSMQGELQELIRVSRELRRDRELAFCGTEDLTPSEFYSKRDALTALKAAEAGIKFVRKVVEKKKA